MEKLKELIGRIDSKRGFRMEDFETETGEPSLCVTNDRKPGCFVVERTKIDVKTIGGKREINGYLICEVTSHTESDTGLVWDDSREIVRVRSACEAVKELAALFAKNDIDAEIAQIQEFDTQRLAEAYYATLREERQ
jgi:hypothetical protein